MVQSVILPSEIWRCHLTHHSPYCSVIPISLEQAVRNNYCKAAYQSYISDSKVRALKIVDYALNVVRSGSTLVVVVGIVIIQRRPFP